MAVSYCIHLIELITEVLTPIMAGRTADTIVSWLEKKTGPPAKTLATVDDAKAFIADNDIAIVGFFDSVDSDGIIYPWSMMVKIVSKRLILHYLNSNLNYNNTVLW